MAYTCFDIGGTSIKYSLIKEEGVMLSKGVIPTIHSSTEDFLLFIVKKVKEFEKYTDIEGIGISVPGIVEKGTGKTILGGAIQHLYGKNIRELLSEYFAYPIYVENDARCALMAELTMGVAQGKQDVVLMTIGTGIGGAVAYNGDILHGNKYSAGEFGMMRLNAWNQPDKTMHQLASTSALIHRYKEKKFLFPSTLIDPQTIFNEMKKDPEAKQIVDEWIIYLAAGLFNIAAAFNPELIVIGGGISANPSLLPLIQEKTAGNPHWKDFGADIRIAKYKNDAGMVGALSFLLSDKKEKSLSNNQSKGDYYVS